MNLYGYVVGNPISQIDPLGLANGPAIGWMKARISRGPSSTSQTVGAAVDFTQSFADMLDATYGVGGAHKGWANQDKYFHCRANCEAAQRGPVGSCTAKNLSDGRERFDQNVKGDSQSSSAADQIANTFGRAQGAAYLNKDCRQLCSKYRPHGSFPANF